MRIMYVLLAVLVVGMASPAGADVLPVGQKAVPCRACVENPDGWPGVVFAAADYFGEELRQVMPVEPGKCMGVVYKFDSLVLFAVPADSPDIDSLVVGGDPSLRKANMGLSAGQVLVDENDTLTGVDEIYRVLDVTETEVVLEHTRTVYHYSDRADEVVEPGAGSEKPE